MARIIKSHEAVSSYERNSAYAADSQARPMETADVPPSEKIEDAKQASTIESELSKLKEENLGLARRIRELENELSSANEQYTSKLDAALEEAVQLGMENGKNQFLDSVAEELSRLRSLIDDISTQYKGRLEDSLDDVVDLIFFTLSRIVATKYAKDEIRNIVEDSLAKVISSSLVNIYVSDKDIGYFAGYEFPNKKVNIKVDSKIKYGGCIVEVDNERLDNRLEKRMEIFKQMMLEEGADDI